MMDSEEQIKQIAEVLKDLLEEGSVPKNVRDNIDKIIKILEEKDDISIKVDKALHELDEIADDSNMQQYTRTQIWNVVSMLEKITA